MNSSLCFKCERYSVQMLATICSHNLCIPCAGKAFQQGNQMFDLICPDCHRLTRLDPETVQVLATQKFFQTEPRTKTSSSFDSNNLIPIIQPCSNHPGEEPTLFCFTCLTPCFCLECHLGGLHKNHDVKSIQKGFRQLQDNELSPLICKLQYIHESLLNDQTRFCKQKSELLNTIKKAKDHVKQNFQLLYLAIQQREQELYVQAEQLAAEQLSALEAQQKKIKESLEIMGRLKVDIDKIESKSQIGVFNWYATEQTSFKKIMDSISEIREKTQPLLQIKYTLDPQVLIKQIDEIKNISLLTQDVTIFDKPSLQENMTRLRQIGIQNLDDSNISPSKDDSFRGPPRFSFLENVLNVRKDSNQALNNSKVHKNNGFRYIPDDPLRTPFREKNQ